MLLERGEDCEEVGVSTLCFVSPNLFDQIVDCLGFNAVARCHFLGFESSELYYLIPYSSLDHLEDDQILRDS